MLSILNFAIPKKCLCGEKFSEVQGAICDGCFTDIKFSSSQNSCPICSFPFEYEMGQGVICSDCIAETPHFSALKYVFAYNDFTGGIIKNFKYADATYLGSKLANFLFSKINQFDEQIDIITSVPITQKKLLSRKYNQSAILAKKLADSAKIKCNNQLLIKVKETSVQAGLNKKERQKNLRNSFAVKPKFISEIKGKNILIIDDVYTTGSTLNECAQTINKTGFEGKVFGLVLARVFLQ